MFKRKYFGFVARLFILAIDCSCPTIFYNLTLLSNFQVQVRVFFLSHESYTPSMRDGAMCYLSIKTKDKI